MLAVASYFQEKGGFVTIFDELVLTQTDYVGFLFVYTGVGFFLGATIEWGEVSVTSTLSGYCPCVASGADDFGVRMGEWGVVCLEWGG